jgi:chromosome segregation ATPase
LDLFTIVVGWFFSLSHCFLPFRAILCITDEICEESTTLASSREDVDNIWRTVACLLTTKMPRMLSQDKEMSTPEMRILLLSALFCYAVSDDCREQRSHVKSVLELPSDNQRTLMTLIEKGQTLDSQPESPTTPRMSGSKRNIDYVESTDAPCEGVFRLPDTCTSSDNVVDSFFLPDLDHAAETIISLPSHSETLIADLREQIKIIKQELDSSQKREQNLMQCLEDNDAKFREEMMTLESISRRPEEDTRDDYRQEIARLQTETRDAHEELERQMMATINDQPDVLRHTEGKLAETEEKLKVCRERLEKMAEVKKSLKREEQAHIATVEEFHHLQKELKSMQPLKRQLGEYKKRATDAEQKLVEREEELKVMCQITEDRERRQEEILADSRGHKEDAEELRRQLVAKEENESLSGAHELNETESTQVAQLRHENMQLRVYLAEVEQHSQCELNFSQEHVVDLEARIDVMTSRVDVLGSELEENNTQLLESQESLVTASRQLREAEARLEALQVEAENWKRKANDAQFFSARRQDLLNTIQKDAENSLEGAEEQELSLLKEVANWMKMATETEEALEKCRNESQKTKQALFIAKTSLDKALIREEVLENKVADLEKSKDSLTEKLEQERGSKEEALATANKILQEECFEEQKVHSASNQTTDLPESNDTLMDTIEELRREQCKLQEENGRFRSLLVACSEVQDQLVTIQRTKFNIFMDENKALKDVVSSTSGSTGLVSPEHESALENVEEQQIEIAPSTMQPDSASAQVEALTRMNAEMVAMIEELKRDQLTGDIQETIDSYKQKALAAASQVIDLSKTNGNLMDTIEGLNRELQEAYDRFQRQLDERFAAYNNVHDQLEILQTEFNALLSENKALKKDVSTVFSLQKCVISAISGSTEVFSSRGTHSGGGFYGSTPERLRTEFEIKVESLMKEKRKLIIRSNEAITGMQKAEQQARESSQQVARLKKELEAAKIARSALKLALECSLSQDSDGTNDSGYTNGTKENDQLSVEASGLEVVGLGAKIIAKPNMQDMSAPLSPSSMNKQARC